MFLFFLTFEAGHVLKVVLKFWPNLRLNVLIKFVLKKTKECRPTMRPHDFIFIDVNKKIQQIEVILVR